MTAHHNHFHIDLRPPELVQIAPLHPLLGAEADTTSAPGEETSTISTVIENAVSDLNLVEKAITMLISPNHMPAAIISQASGGTVDSVNEVGLCFIVPNGAGHNPQSAENVIDPRVAMAVYFAGNGGPELALADISMPEIASSPTHGQLVPVDQGNYVYLPNSGYFGPDKASNKRGRS